jgi:hypothetical protein
MKERNKRNKENEREEKTAPMTEHRLHACMHNIVNSHLPNQ